MIKEAMYQCQYFQYDKNSKSQTIKCEFFSLYQLKLYSIYHVCTKSNYEYGLITPKKDKTYIIKLINSFVKTHRLLTRLSTVNKISLMKYPEESKANGKKELCLNLDHDQFNMDQILSKFNSENEIIKSWKIF